MRMGNTEAILITTSMILTVLAISLGSMVILTHLKALRTHIGVGGKYA